MTLSLSPSDVSAVHPEKALAPNYDDNSGGDANDSKWKVTMMMVPMVVAPLEIVTDVSPVHSWKALAPNMIG